MGSWGSRRRAGAFTIPLVVAGALAGWPPTADASSSAFTATCTVGGAATFRTAAYFGEPGGNQPYVLLHGSGVCVDTRNQVSLATFRFVGPGTCATGWSYLLGSLGFAPAVSGLNHTRDLFLDRVSPRAQAGAIVGRTSRAALDPATATWYRKGTNGVFEVDGRGCGPENGRFTAIVTISDAIG